MSFHSKSFYSIRSTFFNDENARRRLKRARLQGRPTLQRAPLQSRFSGDAETAVRLYSNNNPKKRNLERPPSLFLKNFSQFGRLSRFYRLNARFPPPAVGAFLLFPAIVATPSTGRLDATRPPPPPTLTNRRRKALFSPQKNASNVATGATGKTLSKSLLILFFSQSDDSSKVKKRNGACESPRAVLNFVERR